MNNLFSDFSNRYGQLFTLHPHFFDHHGEYGFSNLVEHAATEVRTAFTNHIKLNFITRMRNGLIRVWLRRNGHRDNKRIREMLSDLICGGWKPSYSDLIVSNDLGEYRWEGAGQVPIDTDTNDLSILEVFVYREHRILRMSQCDESVQFRIYSEWDGEPDYSWMDRNPGVVLVAIIRYLHEVESFNESVENGRIQANKVRQWTIVPMASETLRPFPIDEQTVLLVAMDSGIISSELAEYRVNYTARNGNVTNQGLGYKNSKSSGFGRLFMDQIFHRDPKEAIRQRKVDVAAGRQIPLPLPGDAVPFTTSRNGPVDGLLGVPDISGLETVILPGTRPGHVLVNGVERRVPSLAEEPTAPISARETPHNYIKSDGVTLNIVYDVRERGVESGVESDKEDAEDEENETVGVGPVFSLQARKYHERKIAERTVQELRQDPPVDNESPEERLAREKRNKKRRYRRNKARRRIEKAQSKFHMILHVFIYNYTSHLFGLLYRHHRIDCIKS